MRKTGPSSRARFCKKPAGSRTNARVSPISGKENRPGNSRSGRRGFVSAMRVVPPARCTATARDCPAAGTGVDAHAASMKRGRSPWPPSTNECYLRSSGDLVNRRVGDLIGLKLRSPLDELSQRIQLLLIARAAVGLRVLPRLPEADRDRFRSARVDERHFVLEALLL